MFCLFVYSSSLKRVNRASGLFVCLFSVDFPSFHFYLSGVFPTPAAPRSTPGGDSTPAWAGGGWEVPGRALLPSGRTLTGLA